jgi:hypothetical protein
VTNYKLKYQIVFYQHITIIIIIIIINIDIKAHRPRMSNGNALEYHKVLGRKIIKEER